MNKNIEHYFYHKENFLDEKYCENCIKVLNMCVWNKHEWYFDRTNTKNSEQGNEEPEYITPDSFSDKAAEINNFIVQNLHSLISEYIYESVNLDWFEGWTGYSAMKFLRYYPGQTMKNHCDHIYDMFDGERRGIPILSIIGLLNDDYEGGELIMFEDKKIDTKKGDLMIFPSNFLYPHQITPVTKGVRYSYVSWAW